MLVQPTVHLVVDHYSAFEAAQRNRGKTDPIRTAEGLGMAANLLGPVTERFAIVEENDREGWDAFTKANFQVRQMNGDRPQAIYEVIEKLRHDLQGDHQKYLVAVTDDLAFHQLFQEVQRHNTELRVLVPGREIPLLFRRGGYDVRLLNEVIPEPKPTRYDLRIDFENVWIGLKRNGFAISPKQLIQAIKQKAAELGDVGTITAYADWDLLSRDSRYNLQRELALISGVETRYQPNESGKNSADMVIADHIRTVIERPNNAPDAVDIAIICTGDRDFRQVVDTVKGRNKKAVLFAVKDTLSNELKLAADEVYYLDDLLPAATVADPTQPPQADHPQAELALKFLAFLQRKHWKFAYANRTEEIFGPTAEAQLRESVTVQVLEEQDGKFSPNYQHPLIQAGQHLLRWVPWRLKVAREQRGFSEVYASYLFKEMARDRKLQDWQIGQDWDEAAAWLDRLAATGSIIKGSRPHPHKEGETIITWSLPGSKPSPTAPVADKVEKTATTDAEPEETLVEPINPAGAPEPSATSPTPPDPDRQKLIATHKRRLQHLREREAREGHNVDPQVLIEIEDIEAKLETLRQA